jgi:hypothetical protein
LTFRAMAVLEKDDVGTTSSISLPIPSSDRKSLGISFICPN